MATVSGKEQKGFGNLDARRGWSAFSESERQQMLRDDIRAALTVALILTGVVFAGLLIGLIGVSLSLWQ